MDFFRGYSASLLLMLSIDTNVCYTCIETSIYENEDKMRELLQNFGLMFRVVKFCQTNKYIPVQFNSIKTQLVVMALIMDGQTVDLKFQVSRANRVTQRYAIGSNQLQPRSLRTRKNEAPGAPTCPQSPGNKFSLGGHKVEYEASDEAGWTTKCIFTVVLRPLLPE